jgi:hypothetical protein
VCDTVLRERLRLTDGYKSTSWFLCTDDPFVIAQLGDYPQFDFVHLHFDRTVFFCLIVLEPRVE